MIKHTAVQSSGLWLIICLLFLKEFESGKASPLPEPEAPAIISNTQNGSYVSSPPSISVLPTQEPTEAPLGFSTVAPNVSFYPSLPPIMMLDTDEPTEFPTLAPATSAPTTHPTAAAVPLSPSPTVETLEPTMNSTSAPATFAPVSTTGAPSNGPSGSPSEVTPMPSLSIKPSEISPMPSLSASPSGSSPTPSLPPTSSNFTDTPSSSPSEIILAPPTMAPSALTPTERPSFKEMFLGIAPFPVTDMPVLPKTVSPEPTIADVTETPVTASPVTEAPVTASPITSSPVTASPVTPSPTGKFGLCHVCGSPGYIMARPYENVKVNGFEEMTCEEIMDFGLNRNIPDYLCSTFQIVIDQCDCEPIPGFETAEPTVDPTTTLPPAAFPVETLEPTVDPTTTLPPAAFSETPFSELPTQSSTIPTVLLDAGIAPAIVPPAVQLPTALAPTIAVPGTVAPTTGAPVTEAPITPDPTIMPSAAPSTPPPTNRPTRNPSASPSVLSSSGPTEDPTAQPSVMGSSVPTVVASSEPSASPSVAPSSKPTLVPSSGPSLDPSASPSVGPTRKPSSSPTHFPTEQPSAAPTEFPSHSPTGSPSSNFPTTTPSSRPSVVPGAPTVQPTDSPVPSNVPTPFPTVFPSEFPTNHPTKPPTPMPTAGPTPGPTMNPTPDPTPIPTPNPTPIPTPQPSPQPTPDPTPRPTPFPTPFPTTSLPSVTPGAPTSSPTMAQPSENPSSEPSVLGSASPSIQPSSTPTGFPSFSPSEAPSLLPSISLDPTHTNPPTSSPTLSIVPSTSPSSQPSTAPSVNDLPLQELPVLEMFMTLGNTDPMSRSVTAKWQIETENRIGAEVQRVNGDQLRFVSVVVVVKSQTPEFGPTSSPTVTPEDTGGSTSVARTSGGDGGDFWGLRRNLDAGDGRSLQENELVVEFGVDILLRSEKTDHDAEGYITGAFNSVVDRDEFITSLESSDPHFRQTNSIEVTVPTSPPTSGPTAASSNSTGTGLIAGLVAVGVSGAALAGFFLYSRQRRRKLSSNPVTHVADVNTPHDFASQIEVEHDREDISTLGDPIPPGLAREVVEPSVADSFSLDYDFKRTYRVDQPSQMEVSTDSANNSHLVVPKDDETLDAGYFAEDQFEIEAPAGMLGLVLETSADGVPTVHAIKPTSALATQVKVGDRLLSVDGDDVTVMLAGDVSRLIAERRENETRRFIFTRPHTSPSKEVNPRPPPIMQEPTNLSAVPYAQPATTMLPSSGPVPSPPDTPPRTSDLPLTEPTSASYSQPPISPRVLVESTSEEPPLAVEEPPVVGRDFT